MRRCSVSRRYRDPTSRLRERRSFQTRAIEASCFSLPGSGRGSLILGVTSIFRGRVEGRRGGGRRSAERKLVTRWHGTAAGCSSLGRHRTFALPPVLARHRSLVAPTSEIRRCRRRGEQGVGGRGERVKTTPRDNEPRVPFRKSEECAFVSDHPARRRVAP